MVGPVLNIPSKRPSRDPKEVKQNAIMGSYTPRLLPRLFCPPKPIMPARPLRSTKPRRVANCKLIGGCVIKLHSSRHAPFARIVLAFAFSREKMPCQRELSKGWLHQLCSRPCLAYNSRTPLSPGPQSVRPKTYRENREAISKREFGPSAKGLIIATMLKADMQPGNRRVQIWSRALESEVIRRISPPPPPSRGTATECLLKFGEHISCQS